MQGLSLGVRVSKMGKLQDKDKLGKFHVYIQWYIMCMLVIVAPPIVMGAWSVAFLLGQQSIIIYNIMCIQSCPHVQ